MDCECRGVMKIRPKAKSSSVLVPAFACALTLVFPSSPSATAVEGQKTFNSCKSVWKKYPTGLVPSKFFAVLASKQGWQRPRINGRDYFDSPGLWRDGGGSNGVPYIICPVAPRPTVPAPPQLISASQSESGVGINLWWSRPSAPFVRDVYDVYLNGAKISEGLTSTFFTFTGLAPATQYTVGVTARNSGGTSQMTTAQVTTITQEQADNPGKVKVVYIGTGVVDVTLQAPTGTQQFSDVTNPTYEFWFRPGEFVYFSVQNQNDNGAVSCLVTSNGRPVSANSSSGAYVIATCSGKS